MKKETKRFKENWQIKAKKKKGYCRRSTGYQSQTLLVVSITCTRLLLICSTFSFPFFFKSVNVLHDNFGFRSRDFSFPQLISFLAIDSLWIYTKLQRNDQNTFSYIVEMYSFCRARSEAIVSWMEWKKKKKCQHWFSSSASRVKEGNLYEILYWQDENLNSILLTNIIIFDSLKKFILYFYLRKAPTHMITSFVRSIVCVSFLHTG